MNSENKTNTVYFTFMLGDVTYAIDVHAVKEVLVYEEITPVPRSADYLKGVMNNRGSVIPIIDFRILFGQPAATDCKGTSIIVTEVVTNGEPPLLFGFIADAVEEVSELDSGTLQDLSDPGLDSVQNHFIKKIGKIGDKFALLLGMDEIVSHIEQDLELNHKD